MIFGNRIGNYTRDENSEAIVSHWNAKNTYDSNSSNRPPAWPNEFLVKLLSSSAYSDIPTSLTKQSKVLEVGAFAGNNARLFEQLELLIYAVEVNSEMVEFAKSNFENKGIEYQDIKIGTNENLNYDNEFFDLLVSINTIHYSSEGKMDNALREFSRVTKSNGYCVIETPAQDHYIVRESDRMGTLNYLWKSGGFRQGNKMGFFDSKTHFKETVSKYFKQVEILQRSESFLDYHLSWWIAICRK